MTRPIPLILALLLSGARLWIMELLTGALVVAAMEGAILRNTVFRLITTNLARLGLVAGTTVSRGAAWTVVVRILSTPWLLGTMAGRTIAYTIRTIVTLSALINVLTFVGLFPKWLKRYDLFGAAIGTLWPAMEPILDVHLKRIPELEKEVKAMEQQIAQLSASRPSSSSYEETPTIDAEIDALRASIGAKEKEIEAAAHAFSADIGQLADATFDILKDLVPLTPQEVDQIRFSDRALWEKTHRMWDEILSTMVTVLWHPEMKPYLSNISLQQLNTILTDPRLVDQMAATYINVTRSVPDYTEAREQFNATLPRNR